MKINIDIPLNIGDIFFAVMTYEKETPLDEDNIWEAKLDSASVNNEGAFAVDENKDWWGRIDKIDSPIIDENSYYVFSTRENACKAIQDWNKNVWQRK